MEENLQSHKLVTSHLRLVAKIAMGYRGYGLPVNELISEGKLGSYASSKKFDPDKGFRLATYALVDKSSNSRICLKILEFSKNGDNNSTKKAFF